MSFMYSRLQSLEAAFHGLQATGVPLVAQVAELGKSTYTAAGATDDLGMYYFIPKIAVWLGITGSQAAAAFFIVILLMSMLLAIVGCCLLFKSWVTRILAVLIFSSFAVSVLKVSTSVYLIPAATVMCIVPLFVYFIKGKRFSFLILFVIFSGFVLGYAHYIRSFSAIPVLFFILCLTFVGNNLSKKRKCFVFLALLLGLMIPVLNFTYVIHKRDVFLSRVSTETPASFSNHHPMWDSMYLGLGYYKNPYNIKYADNSGVKKVASIKSGVIYLSSEYDEILKRAYFSFIKDHPAFYIKSQFKKVYRMISHRTKSWCLILFLLIFFPKKNRWIDVAFILSILISILPGVLVVPLKNYILGYISLLYSYAMLSIGFAIEHPRAEWLLSWFADRIKPYRNKG